jgi:alkyl hydroperoxide reductase subunit AhpF
MDSQLGRRAVKQLNVLILENHWVASVRGDEFARTLVLAQPNGVLTELNADAFFVELGLVPNSGLVKSLVALDEQGRVRIDARNRTSAEGIFAAGNVTDAFADGDQHWLGEGAKAALSAYEYLRPNRCQTKRSWSRRGGDRHGHAAWPRG